MGSDEDKGALARDCAGAIGELGVGVGGCCGEHGEDDMEKGFNPTDLIVFPVLEVTLALEPNILSRRRVPCSRKKQRIGEGRVVTRLYEREMVFSVPVCA